MKDRFLEGLAEVEAMAARGRLARFLRHPSRYLLAILHRKLIYPFQKNERLVWANTFFGRRMRLALPAATDIYLTGGKTHSSETRLAKFLIRNLAPNSIFVDVGAHVGYFSLLAHELITEGQVFAFEPASSTFQLLQENTSAAARISTYNKAVSQADGFISFFEFDNLHSEYNSATVDQFAEEEWFQKNKTKERKIESVSLDRFFEQQTSKPTHIKIDVEGFEPEVIEGAAGLLMSAKPVIILEYLAEGRNNEPHRKAHRLLLARGYKSYYITHEGTTVAEPDPSAYLQRKKLDSDNILYLP